MPTPVILNSANLFYKAGSSDKVYHLWTESVGANHTVKFRYGRRGSTLNEGKKNTMPTHAGAALKIFNDILMEKLGKGYKLMDEKGREIVATDEEKDLIKDVAEAITTVKSMKAADAKPLRVKTVAKVVPDETDFDRTLREAVESAAKKKTSEAHVPMLLNQTTRDRVNLYMKDKKWVFQEKHDGRRMMLHQRPGGFIEAYNRKGEKIEPPSEYCSVLQSNFSGFEFCIDGEACGPVFWAFDILKLEGMNCANKPLEDRLMDLGMLIRSSGTQDTIRMVVTAETEAHKKMLLNEIKRKRGEGVAIKERNTRYISGRPASGGHALKFKFVTSASLKVMAINSKRSVAVGAALFESGKDEAGPGLRSVGNVSIPVNHEIPKVGDIVEVQYLYFYGEGSLYQPVYLGKRDDVEVDALGTLKLKGDQE